MRNVSLSHHTSHHATSYHHFQPDSLGESASRSFLSLSLSFGITKLSGIPEPEIANESHSNSFRYRHDENKNSITIYTKAIYTKITVQRI